MTVGNRHYSEQDMLQMQKEAERRVMEMHQYAQDAVGASGAPARPSMPPPPMRGRGNFRNWNAGPNIGRRGPTIRQPERPQEPPPPKEPEKKEPPILEQEQPAAPFVPEPPKENKTRFGGILDAVGIDDDRLLIIGLMLILLNEKADNMLILALGYLLL